MAFEALQGAHANGQGAERTFTDIAIYKDRIKVTAHNILLTKKVAKERDDPFHGWQTHGTFTGMQIEIRFFDDGPNLRNDPALLLPRDWPFVSYATNHFKKQVCQAREGDAPEFSEPRAFAGLRASTDRKPGGSKMVADKSTTGAGGRRLVLLMAMALSMVVRSCWFFN